MFRERRERRERMERAERETVDLHVAGLDEPVRIRAEALREIAAALMPLLIQRGSVTLTIGSPGISLTEGGTLITEHPVTIGTEGS